jgi:hypothetical protein
MLSTTPRQSALCASGLHRHVASSFASSDQAAAEHAAFNRGQVAGRGATATGVGATTCVATPVGATVVTECK